MFFKLLEVRSFFVLQQQLFMTEVLMEINAQVSKQNIIGIEKNHLFNIQNNIEIWEKYQSHAQINQKKLTQTTFALKNSGLNCLPITIKIPSTYFGGLEESYSIELKLDDKNQHIHEKEDFEPIQLNKDYHRVSSIYEMENVIQMTFNALKNLLPNNELDDLEVLTSLILFEVEQLSKHRNSEFIISQEMFSIDNPHIKWFSSLKIKSKFTDYYMGNVTKYYH